jgi:predicted acylesterase/phospholipase RssA
MGNLGPKHVNSSGETHAMVLSGGGAYGAFEVGVMKVLMSGHSPSTGYQPLQPEVFTGTSAGALNASLMVSGSAENHLSRALRLESVWLNKVAAVGDGGANGIYRVRGDPFQYLRSRAGRNGPTPITEFTTDSIRLGRYFFARTLNFLAGPRSVSERLVQYVDLSAFVSNEPFQDLVGSVIDSEAILQSGERLSVIATNWITGEARIFENKDFGSPFGSQAVMASAAIPGLFPPVQVGDDLYADGGAVMDTPLKPAIQSGAATLHVIYVNPLIHNIPIQGQTNTVDTFLRVYAIMLATKISEDIATVRWINEGITAMERLRASRGLSPDDTKWFVRVANQLLKQGPDERLYRKLTIHRYYPERELGSSMGFLDFRQDTIARIIEHGEHRALNHDCMECECVSPE